MSATGTKRPHDGSRGGHRGGPKPQPAAHTQGHQPEQPVTATGPYISMFTGFRNELDEHHDRRERIIKASRDVTAASKKIIFTLQRLRPTTLPVPAPGLPTHITTEIRGYEARIQQLLTSLLPDLQGINARRYSRQISPGVQEYLEAIGFRHYLLHGEVVSWETAAWYVSGLNGAAVLGQKAEEQNEEGKQGKSQTGDVEMTDVAATATAAATTDGGSGSGGGDYDEGGQKTGLQGITLTREDYILGLFDVTGEMMRFAITSVATTPLTQLLPGSAATTAGKSASTPHVLLQDLRTLRLAFESLDLGHSAFGLEAEKKLAVMRESVAKVEYAFYGMVVRGRERPDGWVQTVDVTTAAD